MNIGNHLREARERRGLTLRQISDSTKLSTATLQHIEQNELDRVPGGIFTKGHLRAYAAEVGIDADEVINEYVAQYPAPTEELPVRPAAPFEGEHVGRHLVATLAVVALALAVHRLLPGSPGVALPSREFVQAPAVVESLVAEPVSPGAPSAAEPAETGLHLEIAPDGECWVSAVADGRLVVYRLLEGGDHVSIVANDELLLRVGAPETFTYTLNGVPGRRLGQAGRPVTVEITGVNYQTFLAESSPRPSRG